ncbi:hypothetical protein HYFRA_00013556 [Hymenoscyphus fraxineus]|uniref:N-acetyltransferase domain-containing protein n=1 Tax=Hymenoscyphus fraxineus TaxID=746836 RepID=A0A9N9LBT8_9HELO|nr:hypothetical protein HYFRA_00013556 [Hymenoscyphus fraxineus]
MESMARTIPPLFQLFHPIFGATEADVTAGLQADKERAWSSHSDNPASHWIVVVNSVTDEFVGAVQWLIFTESPFTAGIPVFEATWWPEGEGRELASQNINQTHAPRVQWMNRPHLAVNQTSVHPNHRSRGVGTRLMQWGIDQADKLGLEVFIEASQAGKPLYDKFGMINLMKIEICPEKKNPGYQWKNFMHELLPMTFYCLWRPAGGKLVEGGSQNPWQVMDSILYLERA